MSCSTFRRTESHWTVLASQLEDAGAGATVGSLDLRNGDSLTVRKRGGAASAGGTTGAEPAVSSGGSAAAASQRSGAGAAAGAAAGEQPAVDSGWGGGGATDWQQMVSVLLLPGLGQAGGHRMSSNQAARIALDQCLKANPKP